MRTVRRAGGRIVLLVGLATAVAEPARAQAGALEEGIVEIHVARLQPLTAVVRVDAAGGVLLPALQLARHLGVPVTRTGAELAFLRSGGGSAVLDVSARSLQVAARRRELGPAELVDAGAEVYLATSVLEIVLDAAVEYQPAALTVSLRRLEYFPAQQQVLAEERRAVMLATRQRRERAERAAAAPYAATTLPGVLDWELSTTGLDPAALTRARLQGGAAVLGGDMLATAVFGIGRAARHSDRELSARYQRAFGHAALRQLSAGSIVTTGMFARFIAGAELTNRPFQRPQELGTVEVRPDLPPGWDYEVVQGGQLLGYSDASRREPVSVPLRPGATPVQVRMYGPAGQEVVSTLLYQTPVTLLPQRSLEYTIGAGTCRSGACARYAHADVRFGATSHVTFGGGVEYLDDSIASAVRPYAVASLTTGTAATAELQLMPGAQYGGTFMLFPRDGSRALLRGTISRPGFGPVSLIGSSNQRWDAEAVWDERVERAPAGVRSLRLAAGASGSATAGLERWRASIGAGVARGSAELRYDAERLGSTADVLTARTVLLVPVPLGATAVRPLISGAVGVARTGLALAELGATLQRGAGALNASVAWHGDQRGTLLQFGWSARIGPVHSAVRAVAGGGSGGAMSSALLSGSLAVAPDGSVSAFPLPRTSYGGFYGTVFLDHDGDGRFSPGDSPLPRAQLLAGDLRVTADDSGRFRAWGVVPFTPVDVALDSSRMVDPAWTTSGRHIARAAPNAARRVDIALIQTRELLGAVTADDALIATAGVSLTITHIETGAITTAVTFSDGLFYVSRIRPGRYRLAVAPASLEALRAVAQPAALEFDVPKTGEDPLLELPPLRLRLR